MGAPDATVMVVSGPGASDALNGLMTSIAQLLRGTGLEVAYFDLSKLDRAGSDQFFQTVSSGKVAFALTYLGIGQALEVETKKGGNRNVWEFFNVPLLKLHGDIPAYFLERHLERPLNAVNLYAAEEFLAFHRALLPNCTCPSVRIDPWIISDLEEATVDFTARRSGRLYFLKNGGAPAELEAMWRERLSAPLARQLLELAEEVRGLLLRPGPLDLLGLVQGFLAARGVDLRADAQLLCFYAAHADDYLRRVKSTMIATALLEFPVVILGQGWEHLADRAAKATFEPPMDFWATEEIFRSALGVVDMSPNLDSCCHDRIMRAAGTHAFALTNRTAWVEGLHPDLAAAGFTFEPDAIRAAVDAALRHPDRCVELGREFGRRFRARYRPQDFVDRLCTVAEMARLRHAKPKPQLQPYMVW